MKTEEPIMTNREILRDIHSKTTEMYQVVMGNPKADQDGLVQKVAKLEKDKESRGKVYLFISSISAGIAFAFHYLIEWLKNK